MNPAMIPRDKACCNNKTATMTGLRIPELVVLVLMDTIRLPSNLSGTV